MDLKRKPQQPDINNFIKEAKSQTPSSGSIKYNTKTCSFSLPLEDAAWFENIVKGLNKKTVRKIPRSEVLLVAFDFLKTKSEDEIMELIRTR